MKKIALSFIALSLFATVSFSQTTGQTTQTTTQTEHKSTKKATTANGTATASTHKSTAKKHNHATKGKHKGNAAIKHTKVTTTTTNNQ